MNLGPSTSQKLLHRFLMMKSVSAILGNVLHCADAILLHLTNDRYTFTGFVGLPILQLTTIGAKTGKLRTSPLVGLRDGNKIALIASSFGRAHNPGWYFNLKAHPECVVRFNGRTETFIARETDGDEREKYWQLALSYYAGYEKYQARVRRKIPVMLLEPKF
ncbi:MAG: nitroreductase family deazaflavin-dependent oxidoreductase [Anaerolineales bacterium]